MKIQHPLILVLALLSALGLWHKISPLQGQVPVRAIILSWDAGVPAMIQDLLRQGKLPNLQRLIAGGAFADSVVTVFPSRTAPGNASLWTGAPPRVNGISGNSMPRTPRSQFTILESTLGFHSTSLSAEPLWISGARSGRRAVIIQSTQVWPFEPYLAGGLFGGGLSTRPIFFEGYAGTVGRDDVLTAKHTSPRTAQGWRNLPESAIPPREITFAIGTTHFFGLLIDDPEDPLRGYDTLIVARAKDGEKAEARLKARSAGRGVDHWSPPVELESKGEPSLATRLRLFELKADGSDFLLYFTRPARELSSHPELLPELRKAAGVFVGDGARSLYRQGAFGPTIPQGGDGSAERRYLETVLLNQKQFMEATRWALETLPWDLLFTYTPYPDEAEHLWRGYLEPILPGFRPEIADRLRPFLEEVYRTCDEFLGLLMRLRPPNTVIALVSDHGMEGVNKTVAINAALARAGLLVLDKQNRVDLSKTRALYPTANNAYILINTKDRKGGIVSPEERALVVDQIRQALQGIRDGDRQTVTGIFDAHTEGETMGIGGETGGDIYLDLLPGYDFDARFNSRDLIMHREPYGAHGFNPSRTSMRTIMVLNGPGVSEGQRLKAARTIDFAPTLARLLGIEAPRGVTGRVLQEALSR
ncbi:MAG: alkaline phosphatase family protein [Candidatus Binatia bacterium]